MRGPRRARGRYLTVMLVPDKSEDTRTFRLSYAKLSVLGGLAAAAALVFTLIAGSWWYLAARASRVADLETEVAELQGERDRVAFLARQLDGLERQYEQIRHLFGSGSAPRPSEVWMSPPPGSSARGGTRPAATAARPSAWPLTERGFVTQGVLDGRTAGEADHRGLDIAVPTDSYVRAAGAGTVVDEGEDPVYGRFVVVDHGEGYTSLYAHASMSLVVRGQRVRRNEVIALSGSSGRSTAPHLHFEILLNGEAVDPLTMVQQP